MNRDQQQSWILDPRLAVGLAAAITILTAILSPSCGSDTSEAKARAEYLDGKQQRFTEALNDR
jgi:hypothetical protein